MWPNASMMRDEQNRTEHYQLFYNLFFSSYCTWPIKLFKINPFHSRLLGTHYTNLTNFWPCLLSIFSLFHNFFILVTCRLFGWLSISFQHALCIIVSYHFYWCILKKCSNENFKFISICYSHFGSLSLCLSLGFPLTNLWDKFYVPFTPPEWKQCAHHSKWVVSCPTWQLIHHFGDYSTGNHLLWCVLNRHINPHTCSFNVNLTDASLHKVK